MPGSLMINNLQHPHTLFTIQSRTKLEISIASLITTTVIEHDLYKYFLVIGYQKFIFVNQKDTSVRTTADMSILELWHSGIAFKQGRVKILCTTPTPRNVQSMSTTHIKGMECHDYIPKSQHDFLACCAHFALIYGLWSS